MRVLSFASLTITGALLAAVIAAGAPGWALGLVDPADPLLARLSEEAAAFRSLAPKIIGQETLTHKGRQAPPRIRWLSKKDPPEVRYRTKSIVSEYGFGYFTEAPGKLREFRQVVSVDGRARTETATKDARQVLAQNMNSDDDRLRRRLLEDFERYGQTGSATDFGQILLLFERRALPFFDFTTKRDIERAGQSYHVVHWAQLRGGEQLNVFSQRRLEHIPMEGDIWFRTSDNLPLRVTMKAELDEDGVPVTFAAELDYERSPYGLLLPRHLHLEKKMRGLMLIDNHSDYAGYQMFGAKSDIVFEAEPAPAGASQ
jgi:hypothetical protein